MMVSLLKSTLNKEPIMALYRELFQAEAYDANALAERYSAVSQGQGY
jgi:hypothetical protein